MKTLFKRLLLIVFMGVNCSLQAMQDSKVKFDVITQAMEFINQTMREHATNYVWKSVDKATAQKLLNAAFEARLKRYDTFDIEMYKNGFRQGYYQRSGRFLEDAIYRAFTLELIACQVVPEKATKAEVQFGNSCDSKTGITLTIPVKSVPFYAVHPDVIKTILNGLWKLLAEDFLQVQQTSEASIHEAQHANPEIKKAYAKLRTDLSLSAEVSESILSDAFILKLYQLTRVVSVDDIPKAAREELLKLIKEQKYQSNNKISLDCALKIIHHGLLAAQALPFPDAEFIAKEQVKQMAKLREESAKLGQSWWLRKVAWFKKLSTTKKYAYAGTFAAAASYALYRLISAGYYYYIYNYE